MTYSCLKSALITCFFIRANSARDLVTSKCGMLFYFDDLDRISRSQKRQKDLLEVKFFSSSFDCESTEHGLLFLFHADMKFNTK